MKKGDIILIPFPFSDLSGKKNSPAIILIADEEDLTVCFISTQFHRQKTYDVVLVPSQNNGLKKESVARIGKIATIDKTLALGRLGTLENSYIQKINFGLIKLFNL